MRIVKFLKKEAKKIFNINILYLVLPTLFACNSLEKENSKNDLSQTITLAAYSTPREVYGKSIIPAFKKYWKEKTGKEVIFETSYMASGAQSRAIIGGFEADIAALSLEPDIESIQKAGLITNNWKSSDFKGVYSTSVVAFAVREGNPKKIFNWSDLIRQDVEVLMPNLKTSGGSMWNVSAIYGSALRGIDKLFPPNDLQASENFLTSVLKNIKIMDKGARESMITFEKGIGDVAITYENEVISAKQAKRNFELIIPNPTLVIEAPVALIDKYVDKHNNRDVVVAFLNFLSSQSAQKSFSEYGFRPVLEGVNSNSKNSFGELKSTFTIDEMGGWSKIKNDLFDSDGVYYRSIKKVGEQKQ